MIKDIITEVEAKKIEKSLIEKQLTKDEIETYMKKLYVVI